ncbi:MAG TPA: MoaD/ThiS family protein [Gemmatimonadales bacterium]
MIRVVLPPHLQILARVDREIRLEVEGPATTASVLDALEIQHPTLRGTIRDAASRERRPFIRYFACGQDVSHQPPEAALPAAVASGEEPLLVVGALAGG